MSTFSSFTVRLSDGLSFTGIPNSTFQVLIIIDNDTDENTILGGTATVRNQQTVTGIPNVSYSLVPPSTHTIELTFNNMYTDPDPISGRTVGSVTFNFTTPTQSYTHDLIYNGTRYTTNTKAITIACLHANSVIITTDGSKYIKDIQSDDRVLTSNGEYAGVIAVAQCWIQEPGPSHDAVIFEPFSLTSSLPTTPLIIDPGHPIKINKEDDFQPAGEFVNNCTIIVRKWTDELVQNPTPSLRWDLVLEDGYTDYIANGVIVKSRESAIDPGYLHRYKKWT